MKYLLARQGITRHAHCLFHWRRGPRVGLTSQESQKSRPDSQETHTNDIIPKQCPIPTFWYLFVALRALVHMIITNIMAYIHAYECLHICPPTYVCTVSLDSSDTRRRGGGSDTQGRGGEGGGRSPLPAPPWCSLGSRVAKTHFTESNFEWYSWIEKCFGYLKSPSYQIYVHAGLIYKCRKSGHFLSRHMRAKWAFSTRNFKWSWLAVISCKLLTLYMKIILEACYVWCGVKQNCIFVCVPVIYQFLSILHSQFFIKQPFI